MYGWQLKFSNIDLIQYSDGRPLSSDLGIVTDMADWDLYTHLSDLQGGSFMIQYLQSHIL